jgi:hypothetical protein
VEMALGHYSLLQKPLSDELVDFVFLIALEFNKGKSKMN